MKKINGSPAGPRGEATGPQRYSPAKASLLSRMSFLVRNERCLQIGDAGRACGIETMLRERCPVMGRMLLYVEQKGLQTLWICKTSIRSRGHHWESSMPSLTRTVSWC